MEPVHKENVQGIEVIIADGFVPPSKMQTIKRFGIEGNDFPMGCYQTIWWAMKSDDEFAIANILFCEAMHDAPSSTDEKRQMRINAALGEANQLLLKAGELVLNA